MTKVIELYETKNSRHSTMIVGASNTAKTAAWKILQNTMTTMKSDGKPGFNTVHVHAINPKALSLGELYGEYNLSTGEWLDGVISSIMRKTCSGKALDWLRSNICSIISTSPWMRMFAKKNIFQQWIDTFTRTKYLKGIRIFKSIPNTYKKWNMKDYIAHKYC